MKKDLVSCIIPTYRRSDSLKRAINSVLNQTYKDIEVIVVDDNNPNDEYSLEVQEKIKTIKDTRLKYIQQDKHINGAAARNVGINNAKGEYIAFLDDDDEWLPNKLEIQIASLKKNPEYGGATCFYTLYNNGKPIRKCPPYLSEDLYRKVFDRSVSVYTTTLVLRKEALDKTGYFDENLIRHQDLLLLLDFLEHEKLYVVQKNLVQIHTDIGGNRPSANQLVKVKKDFFLCVKHHFNNFDKKTNERIFAAHYFEIVYL